MTDPADPVGKTAKARSLDERRSLVERRSPDENPSSLANVHIAPEVLLTIARLTASRVSGVNRLCSVPGGVNRLFKKNFVQGDGLCIEITDEAVFIDIYVALNHDVVVREVCREIQFEVQRAITEMVGLKVGRVNIHVEDIDYPEETKG